MLKFEREVAVARYLGHQMADALRAEDLADGFDLVTFVPMSRRDRRERGFNQAELLARAVARCIGCPVRRVLAKTVRTPPQGRLSAAARKRNLRGAFRPLRCEQGRVLLVDDICTTGSTVEECAQALRRGGSQSVTVLAVARA
jgi:ComF family protein